MPHVVLGTANLFGLVQASESTGLLAAAWDRGFRRFDTAPSYGFGRCEPAVGQLVAGRAPAPVVTTKVGIMPVPPPGLPMRWAKAAARRLPESWQQGLRGSDAPAGHGHFQPSQVRESIELSLQRLGRIDRLMLHEVFPDDVTDELLACVTGYVQRGDVGQLGVATANALTVSCLARAPRTFDVAHVAVGPLAPPVVLPDGVTVRVGHGILGPAAADLKRLATCRDSDPDLAREWREITDATRWAGADGLASALLARAATLDLTDVIVATSRPDRLATVRALVSGEVPVEPAVLAYLDRLAGLG